MDNVVHGHIEAAEHLDKDSPLCGKVPLLEKKFNLDHCIIMVVPNIQAYNITNDAPLPFWDFISRVVTGLDYPPPAFHLPAWLVYFIALLLQFLTLLLKPLVTLRPTFTPMRVALASTHHYYSCQRAKRDFGYKPPVDFDEGLRRAVEHFKKQ